MFLVIDMNVIFANIVQSNSLAQLALIAQNVLQLMDVVLNYIILKVKANFISDVITLSISHDDTTYLLSQCSKCK